MKKQSLLTIIILLIALGNPAYAEGNRKPVGADFFKEVRMISNLKEKNGSIYFIIRQANMEDNNYKNDLYRLEEGEPRRLTSTGDVSNYFVMDDGSIVFRNVRNPKDREKLRRGEPLTVYVRLTDRMGEAEEFLRLPYSVGDIKFIDDRHFFFTAEYDHNFASLLEQAGGDMEKALKEKENNSPYRVFEEIPFWSNGRGDVSGKRNHLYWYDDGEVKELSEPWETVGGLELSRDRQTLLYTSNTFRGKSTRGNRLMRLAVATLKAEDISPFETPASYGSITCVSDDEIILTSNRRFTEISSAAFFRLHLKSGKLDSLYSGDPYGMGVSIGSDVKMGNASSGIRTDRTGFYYLTTEADHAPLIHVDYRDGAVTHVNGGREVILEYLPFKDGFLTVAMLGNKATEVCFLDRKGTFTALTSVNDRLQEEYNIITPLPVTFTNGDGVEITGYAIPPAGYVKGQKYPAILSIHGGPRTAFGACLFHEMQYWANRGYAVFFTNPTGSDGGGNAFANISARYGTVDYRDLMQFTDVAIRTFDFIDPDRLGVTGGSYGGFMTNWIIGHTDRFKAAASQRSIASWISFSNTTDIGFTFTATQIGGDVWTNLDGLWTQSPLKYADRVKTPTLFIHSEEDYRCWLSEGIQMFYALKYFEVPARLCLFKGENHELSRSGKPKNRVRRIEEITSWMDMYLK
ncbi:MAG: S9 family peptidase [Tannerella sp.]|jgi:dipeptidyl aminopeptidase/acylaminoacyl peptidase|nr:S9 family peptidase [Tannerella sp.]